VANGCYLPFPDRYFDAVYSFGGINEYHDIGRGLAEMVRVAKTGAGIVFGDESLPPWLRETEFGQILLSNNPLFRHPLPLEHMPVEARDVVVRWVIGGVYYVIAFRVGDGPPRGDFDIRIPGRRGGTLNTRFFGKLEGVTPEARELARRARERAGVSMHDWLDRVVREAAESQLQKGQTE
jgi:SAM-dependent methyltransferase